VLLRWKCLPTTILRPPPLSQRGESVIAFMGEERVLRNGDNVPVAATEASLSEIKHDIPWVLGGGTMEGTSPCPRDFPRRQPRRLISPLFSYEKRTLARCRSCDKLKHCVNCKSLAHDFSHVNANRRENHIKSPK